MLLPSCFSVKCERRASLVWIESPGPLLLKCRDCCWLVLMINKTNLLDDDYIRYKRQIMPSQIPKMGQYKSGKQLSIPLEVYVGLYHILVSLVVFVNLFVYSLNFH